jgi:hypothetical protein
MKRGAVAALAVKYDMFVTSSQPFGVGKNGEYRVSFSDFT